MKNKKLFAILTLVCFMFTLMPVAAFAAAADESVYVNGKDSAIVKENVPFALTVPGQNVSGYAFYIVNSDNEGVKVFKVGADVSAVTLDDVDTYKVYAIDGSVAANKTSIDSFIDAAQNFGATTYKSTATLVKELAAWAEENELLVEDYATVKIKAASTDYKIEVWSGNTKVADSTTATAITVQIPTNNGFGNEGDLVAKLYKSTDNGANWTTVKGETLKFDTVGYVDVVFEDGNVTANGGKVEFEAVSSTSGDWTVVISYGNDAEVEVAVTATDGVAENVAVYNQPKAPVNIDNGFAAGKVDFKFTDASGSAVELVALTDNANTNAGLVVADTVAKIVVVDKPEDSDLVAAELDLVPAYDRQGANLVKVGDGVYRISGAFDAEGEYTIKVALENGATATAKVTAAEQGDIVRIIFLGAPTTVVSGDQSANLIGANGVVSMDAKGVTAPVTPEFGYNGAAVVNFGTGRNAQISDDEKYIGSTITVYAVYKDFTVTNTITVVEGAAGVKYTSTDAEVATNNTFVGDIIDANGDVVKNVNVDSVKVIVLEKPANAVAVAKAEQALNSNGQVVLNFLASAAGEYKVQTIVTYDTNKMISSTETFTVGGVKGDFKDIVVVSMGADKMIVNNELVALDVAPFITNGRTMMQFNVLYVFGIDVEWVAETQSIVAEGEGLKVVMQLGSKVATVNGAEVALDVAPYTVNGRTVVPVGFITGLLDITPVFTYNADGTIADILFTK